MISIIISSADSGLLQRVKTNIAGTIGLPFEILAFDNRKGDRGICAVYNEGIQQARHDILCFMHEDVEIKTNRWGKVVQDLFDHHPQLGVVGVMGSTYKSVMPTGWPSQGSPESERSYVLQSFRYKQKETKEIKINPANEQLSRVVAVDGAWMCVRKEVTNQFRFDSDTFRGFHCYDVDYCLSAGNTYEIAVTYDVLLEHFSEGKLDKPWMEETLLLYKKWEAELPRSIDPFTKKQVRKIEKQNFRYWLRQVHRLGFDEDLAYWLLRRPKIRDVLGWKYFLKFHYSIFNKYHLNRNRK